MNLFQNFIDMYDKNSELMKPVLYTCFGLTIRDIEVIGQCKFNILNIE